MQTARVPLPADLLASPPVVPLHLQKLYAQSSTDLNGHEQLQLKCLLCAYAHVSSKGHADLGQTSLIQHDIMTRPGASVKQQPRGKNNNTLIRSAVLPSATTAVGPHQLLWCIRWTACTIHSRRQTRQQPGLILSPICERLSLHS